MRGLLPSHKLFFYFNVFTMYFFFVYVESEPTLPIMMRSNQKLNTLDVDDDYAKKLEQAATFRHTYNSGCSVVFVDHQLSYATLSSRYTGIEDTFTTQSVVYRGSNMGDSHNPETLPFPSLKYINATELKQLKFCPQTFVPVVDISSSNEPWRIVEEFETSVAIRPYIIFIAPYMTEKHVEPYAFLQESQNEGPRKRKKYKINVKVTYLPSLFVMGGFLCVILATVYFLMSVDTPAMFLKSPIPVNKEF